jgi:hypothetical protein
VQDGVQNLQAYHRELMADPFLQGMIDGIKEVDEILRSRGLTIKDLIQYHGLEFQARPTRRFSVNHRVKKSNLKRQRRPHAVKQWVNPYTGETYQGKRIAGPMLDWVKEYGREVVIGWKV